MKNKISIIIPNWNGKTLLQKHLPTVIERSEGCEVIVVDDASSDGSVSWVKQTHPSVIIIEKRKHEGFASTVNIGAKKATCDIVILLNSDIEPTKGWIDPLLAHFDDLSVFAVGSMDKSHEREKIVLRGRGLASWEKGFYIHKRGEVNEGDTAWVSGGSGAFRKSMWEALGGMDELFNPFYWEDIDLSYRAKKAGWKTLFEPKSIVHHYHEIGAIQTSTTKRNIQTTAYRNQFIFIWKNLTSGSIWMNHILYLPVRIVQTLSKGDMTMTYGLVLAIMRIPWIIRKRNMNAVECKMKDEEV